MRLGVFFFLQVTNLRSENGHSSYRNDDNCVRKFQMRPWVFFFLQVTNLRSENETVGFLLCFFFFTLYLPFLHFLRISYLFLFLWPMRKNIKKFLFKKIAHSMFRMDFTFWRIINLDLIGLKMDTILSGQWTKKPAVHHQKPTVHKPTISSLFDPKPQTSLLPPIAIAWALIYHLLSHCLRLSHRMCNGSTLGFNAFNCKFVWDAIHIFSKVEWSTTSTTLPRCSTLQTIK